MRVGEANPLIRHLIQPRSLIGRFDVVTGQIAVTEVVGIDDDDVGKFRGMGRELKKNEQPKRPNEGSGSIDQANNHDTRNVRDFGPKIEKRCAPRSRQLPARHP